VGGAYADVRNVLYTSGNLGKLVRKEQGCWFQA
jgi:hypothetical protein